MTTTNHTEPNLRPPQDSTLPVLWPSRYQMVDAWRGLAALAVLLHHLYGPHAIDIGSIAVMFFFVISGYCITASAESCVRSGRGFKSFMWKRVRRIYPPYLFSLIFFVATRLVKQKLTGSGELPHSVALWVQNLTLTQWLTLLFHPAGHPSANPTNLVAAYWSLDYEEQFYLIIGCSVALAIARGARVRSLTLALLGPAVIWNAFFPHRSFGIFLEYWAHFAIGCLVYYRLCSFRGRVQRLVIDCALCLVVLVCAGVVWRQGALWPPQRSVYLELLITSLFALLLINARRFDRVVSSSWIGRRCAQLGLISYSLYLVHQFNLVVIHQIAAKLLPRSTFSPIVLMVEMALHVALATVFWYCCERPFTNSTRVPGTAAERTTVPEAAGVEMA